MRKPRSDSKLLNLPEEQQAQLAEWLLQGMPYHKVRELVAKDFKIDTSLGALSDFYQQVCSVHLLKRRQDAVRVANLIGDEAERSKNIDAGIIAALKQKAFEVLGNPQAGAEEIMFIIGQFLKLRDQDIKTEQVALSRKKFQRETTELFLKWFDDKRAKQIASGGGTRAEKIEQLGRAMFEDWEEG